MKNSKLHIPNSREISISKWLVLALLISTLNSQFATLLAQGTAFTYQGRLNADGQPANGSYDLRFTLFDAASSGSQAGLPITNSATAVSNGLFTVALDFGAGVFTGADRWLDIAVRPGASAVEFTNVVPRQKLTATPYAIYAGNVSASGIVGPISDGQLSGNIARLNGNQTFSGTVNFSSVSNRFAGSFNGNGAGVTNVSVSSLVVTRTNTSIVGWGYNE